MTVIPFPVTGTVGKENSCKKSEKFRRGSEGTFFAFRACFLPKSPFTNPGILITLEGLSGGTYAETFARLH